MPATRPNFWIGIAKQIITAISPLFNGGKLWNPFVCWFCVLSPNFTSALESSDYYRWNKVKGQVGLSLEKARWRKKNSCLATLRGGRKNHHQGRHRKKGKTCWTIFFSFVREVFFSSPFLVCVTLPENHIGTRETHMHAGSYDIYCGEMKLAQFGRKRKEWWKKLK